MPFAEWIRTPTELKRVVWRGPGVLMLLPPGAAHSVWWLRHESGALRAVYVNLEEPAVRWDDGDVAGVDIVDQDLDILARPDGRWEWKDEDEFAERLAYPGHYWVPDPAAVRAEGERLIKKIEVGEFPFDGSYLDFAPDPAWTVPPEVPAGWDRVRA
jgi:predicted RNA-binding protein associated with RNAse of E/G family